VSNVNKGGIGVGSASIVLVFSVLCLTVFTLITFVVAGNEKALVDAELHLVTGYYEADALAEHILAEILTSYVVPDSVMGVDIESRWNSEFGVETLFYYCTISDTKALHVELVLRSDSFDIISWRMWDTDEWEFDDSLNLWLGDDDD
jgi:hypothetical protein